jgi:hypothetical protein
VASTEWSAIHIENRPLPLAAAWIGSVGAATRLRVQSIAMAAEDKSTC